jgi:hypothetical protein
MRKSSQRIMSSAIRETLRTRPGCQPRPYLVHKLVLISPVYNLPMDVRVVIVSLRDESCRVSVVFTDKRAHVWIRKYQSKQLCLTDLVGLGLLTGIEVTDAQVSDFDKTGAMWVIHTETETDLLRAAGFIEQK